MEACRFTYSLFNGRLLRMEFQIVPTSRDMYARLLAYVLRQGDNPLVKILHGTRLGMMPTVFHSLLNQRWVIWA